MRLFNKKKDDIVKLFDEDDEDDIVKLFKEMNYKDAISQLQSLYFASTTTLRLLLKAKKRYVSSLSKQLIEPNA